MKRILIIISLLSAISLMFMGCEMIDYHPYDVNIRGERYINTKNIDKIEAKTKNKDTIRFALMGDTQNRYKETEDFANHINKQNNIDFVIHGGDITEYGMCDEFLLQRDIMNKLHIPYVVIIGNHDCVGNGVESFTKIFGELNFAFIAGDTKFICLNTNALEFNYNTPVPDFEFMEKEQLFRKDEFTKTIFLMHSPPNNNQFNQNARKTYHRMVREFPNPLFGGHAHIHSLCITDPGEDGIIYYGCDSIHHRNYILFTITPQGYTYEIIYF